MSWTSWDLIIRPTTHKNISTLLHQKAHRLHFGAEVISWHALYHFLCVNSLNRRGAIAHTHPNCLASEWLWWWCLPLQSHYSMLFVNLWWRHRRFDKQTDLTAPSEGLSHCTATGGFRQPISKIAASKKRSGKVGETLHSCHFSRRWSSAVWANFQPDSQTLLLSASRSFCSSCW